MMCPEDVPEDMPEEVQEDALSFAPVALSDSSSLDILSLLEGDTSDYNYTSPTRNLLDTNGDMRTKWSKYLNDVPECCPEGVNYPILMPVIIMLLRNKINLIKGTYIITLFTYDCVCYLFIILLFQSIKVIETNDAKESFLH